MWHPAPAIAEKSPPSDGGRILVLKQLKYATTMIARRANFQQHFRGNCCQLPAVPFASCRAECDSHYRRPGPASRRSSPKPRRISPAGRLKTTPSPEAVGATQKNSHFRHSTSNCPHNLQDTIFATRESTGIFRMRSPCVGPDNPSANSPFRCSAT